MNVRLYDFVAGGSGAWSVLSVRRVIGEELPHASRLDVVQGGLLNAPEDIRWTLRGVTSNTRYTTGEEKKVLNAVQAAPGRPEATRAALIPIRKNAAWWDMPQDERRAILEDRSQHIRLGLKYLPAISRRLHHCRDIGSDAPFDFLTWFDYAPEHSQAFEDLVGELRATEEWKFVEREVDLRLTRE